MFGRKKKPEIVKEQLSFSEMIMGKSPVRHEVLNMSDLCPNQDLVIKKKRKKNTKKI